MSDNAKKTFHEDLIAAQELERRKHEIQQKELKLKERRVNSQIERLDQDEKDLEKAVKANFGQLSTEEVEQLRSENAEYMDAARNKMEFILGEFGQAVPYFRKNVIFIGAKTGEGKSTAVANIVRATIRQNRPDGTRRRVLVLTNEEKREDVYNRITCLIKGWAYTNHDKFTDEQVKAFNEYIPILSQLVTVVDDNFGGGSGMTTTPEGLQQTFDNCLRDGIIYDAILIDYYQNYTYSKKDYTLNEWAVQSRVSNILDKMKNVYPAPIVIFGQVTPPDKEGKNPFEFRIKGRKQIFVTATMAMEMIAHREDLKTEWLVHKSRFNEYVGGSIVTGFDKGKFVKYDISFKQKVLHYKEEKQRLEISRASGVYVGVGKKDDKEVPKETSTS